MPTEERHLTTTSSSWSVAEYLSKIATDVIDLRPDFQRNYIWTKKKEAGFIDSIIRGYPVPPVWLWMHDDDDDETRYSVIDGQQRLTCIKRFAEGVFPFKKAKAQLHSQVADDADQCAFKPSHGQMTFSELPKEAKRAFRQAEIPYVTVKTNNRDVVIDVFTRLNQDSMILNAQELRNAVFDGEFKKFIYDEARKLKDHDFWGKSQRAFDKKKTGDRMEVERNLSEILVSMIENKPLNKSDRLDKWYKTYDTDFSEEEPKLKSRLWDALKEIKRGLPSQSRYVRNTSDLYSTVRIYDQIHEEFGKLSKDNSNGVGSALRLFADDFAEWEDRRRSAKSDQAQLKIDEAWPEFKRYRDSIQGPQRDRNNRNTRERILSEIGKPAIRTKDMDEQRLFSETQKSIAWSRASEGTSHVNCAEKKCKAKIVYEEAEFDHIKAWSKGGRTMLNNCQVLCKKCNQAKSAS